MARERERERERESGDNVPSARFDDDDDDLHTNSGMFPECLGRVGEQIGTV